MAGQDVADAAMGAHRRVERVDRRARHAEGDRTPSFSNTRTAASAAVILGICCLPLGIAPNVQG